MYAATRRSIRRVCLQRGHSIYPSALHNTPCMKRHTFSSPPKQPQQKTWPHSVTATVPPLPSPVPRGSRQSVHCRSDCCRASDVRYVFASSYSAVRVMSRVRSASPARRGGSSSGSSEAIVFCPGRVGGMTVSAAIERRGKSRYSRGSASKNPSGSNDLCRRVPCLGGWVDT